jgi:hypothetical protein
VIHKRPYAQIEAEMPGCLVMLGPRSSIEPPAGALYFSKLCIVHIAALKPTKIILHRPLCLLRMPSRQTQSARKGGKLDRDIALFELRITRDWLKWHPHLGSVHYFPSFSIWAERRLPLAQAAMAPLICWS